MKASLVLLLCVALRAWSSWEKCDDYWDCFGGTHCRVGDQRCLSDRDCEWANRVDNTHRNCDIIPINMAVGHVQPWGSCNATVDCDPTPIHGGVAVYCHVGDRRCLTDGQCRWANNKDHTSRDCSHVLDQCYNDHRDRGETDRDCGGVCSRERKCQPGQWCSQNSDCQSGHCFIQLSKCH
eukprot:m51a1_g14355 hypothetical protein (180) ;mRNA; r:197687-198226